MKNLIKSRKGAEEAVVILGLFVMVVMGVASIFYATQSLGRSSIYALKSLELMEESENVRALLDQERRYVTERALYHVGSRGGFSQASECGARDIRQEIPYLTSDFVYYWKNADVKICYVTSDVDGLGVPECDYVSDQSDGSECRLTSTTGLGVVSGDYCVLTCAPSIDDMMNSVKNLIRYEFNSVDENLCSYLRAHHFPSLPEEDCFTYDFNVISYDYKTLQIGFVDEEPWVLRVDYVPLTNQRLALSEYLGGDKIIDYEFSTLVNQRIDNELFKMHSYATDYAMGSYETPSGDKMSWLNHWIDNLLRDRAFDTELITLTVCDTLPNKELCDDAPDTGNCDGYCQDGLTCCYPHSDWISAFFNNYVGAYALPPCARFDQVLNSEDCLIEYENTLVTPNTGDAYVFELGSCKRSNDVKAWVKLKAKFVTDSAPSDCDGDTRYAFTIKVNGNALSVSDYLSGGVKPEGEAGDGDKWYAVIINPLEEGCGDTPVLKLSVPPEYLECGGRVCDTISVKVEAVNSLHELSVDAVTFYFFDRGDEPAKTRNAEGSITDKRRAIHYNCFYDEACAEKCYEALKSIVMNEVRQRLTNPSYDGNILQDLRAGTGFDWKIDLLDLNVDVACEDKYFYDENGVVFKSPSSLNCLNNDVTSYEEVT